MASPFADAAREAAASLAADFVDGPAEPVSPFKPQRAQDPRQRPVIQPNDAMVVGGAAFDAAFNNAIANPGLVRRKPSYQMTEAEYAQHRDRVFGGQPVRDCDRGRGRRAPSCRVSRTSKLPRLRRGCVMSVTVVLSPSMRLRLRGRRGRVGRSVRSDGRR